MVMRYLQELPCKTGGERGIRTPGGITLNGFQDRRIRPLCQLSGLLEIFTRRLKF